MDQPNADTRRPHEDRLQSLAASGAAGRLWRHDLWLAARWRLVGGTWRRVLGVLILLSLVTTVLNLPVVAISSAAPSRVIVSLGPAPPLTTPTETRL